MKKESSEAKLNVPISFQFLGEETLKELAEKRIQSKCLVFKKIECAPGLTDKNQYVPLEIVLAEDHLLERCPQKGMLLSGFEMDYSHQFEVIRKPSVVTGKVGDAEGIRFCLKGSKPIEFRIKPNFRPQMEHFAKVLASKYIVQLGFHNLFKAHQKIGKGMTACVYNAMSFASNRQVAIKSFRRSVYFASENNNGEKSFKKQFKFLTMLQHKNICRFEGVYETENSTYVVLELLPLSLYGYLQKCGFPSLEKAKGIMRGLLQGLNYLHKKGVMHRDLKLENIMVKKNPQDPSSVIPVLVDFGLAEYVDSKEYLYVRCGTPGYVAPEVLKIKSTDEVKTYDSQCDVFSLAVVFHILLFQKPIFEGKELKEVIKKNSECLIDFESDGFKNLGQTGCDFFKKMLEKDPKKRSTAEQALSHPYLAEPTTAQEAEKIQETKSTIPPEEP